MKKLFLSIILIFTLSLSLFACGNTDNTGSNGGGEESGGDTTEDYTNYLFAEGIVPTVISVEPEATKKTGVLTNGIKELLGKAPILYQSDRVKDSGHEIIIGHTRRELSAKAYEALAAVKEEEEQYDVCYAIFAEGGSIAIAYDEDYRLVALEMAIDELVNDIFVGKTELKLDGGLLVGRANSALEYYRAKDEQHESEEWAALAEYLGGEENALYRELRNFYGLYSPDMMDWLVNLYDPEIGGFYYSNSARDTDGFGPDTESTCQALGLIRDTGMTYLHGVLYRYSIPKDIMTHIGMYIKSLQREDGYFYNYQWTDEQYKGKNSRLARDLSSSLGVLDAAGLRPTYKTPAGVVGDGIVVPLPEAAVPAALSAPAKATRAAKLVLASTHPDHLESAETLLAYLNAMEANMGYLRYYAIGNNVTSQMKQIIARDIELRSEFFSDPENLGKPYKSLSDIVVDWFDSRRDPVSGHWEKSGSYLAVNSILKIAGVYNQAGREITDAEKLVLCAFEAITSEENPGGITDIYNTWSAVGGVIGNIEQYGKSASVGGITLAPEERAARLREYVRANAPSAVAATTAKLRLYLKADGSFSYNQKSSAPNSQAMPVAVPGTNEGDVNATILASSMLVNNMFGALGLSEYEVNIFGAEELVIFIDKLEAIAASVKKS